MPCNLLKCNITEIFETVSYLINRSSEIERFLNSLTIIDFILIHKNISAFEIKNDKHTASSRVFLKLLERSFKVQLISFLPQKSTAI